MSRRNKIQRQRSERGFPKFVVPLLLLFLVGLWSGVDDIGARIREKAESSSPKAAASNLSVLDPFTYNWPLSNAPKINRPSSKPAIPILPSADIKFANHNKHSAALLKERLRVLIQEHPVKEIREDFDELVTNQTVSLNFQIEDYLSAEFRVVPSENIIWSEGGSASLDRAYFETLVVNPRWLANLAGEKAILEALLVIYHEYQHRKQYVNSTPTDRMIMEDRQPVIPTSKSAMQALACAHMWQSELEAYDMECQLANEWGADVFGEFCRYQGTNHWPQAVFQILMTSPLSREKCSRVFALAAGHPDPKIFPAP